MVIQISQIKSAPNSLSVLALSSRFDGRFYLLNIPAALPSLSVLALSSRFDGPLGKQNATLR